MGHQCSGASRFGPLSGQGLARVQALRGLWCAGLQLAQDRSATAGAPAAFGATESVLRLKKARFVTKSGLAGGNHVKNWRRGVQPGPRQQNRLEKSPAKPGIPVSERLDSENREFSLRHYIWRGHTLTLSARASLPHPTSKKDQ